mgnify:CR=1 FL=1
MKPLEYLPFRMKFGMFVYGIVETIAEYAAIAMSLDLMLNNRNNRKTNHRNLTSKI